MKDIGKQILLLEKKLAHLNNDVTKLIGVDLLQLGIADMTEDSISKAVANEYVERLIEAYKGQLRELRSQEKLQSRQLEIKETNNCIHPLGYIKDNICLKCGYVFSNTY